MTTELQCPALRLPSNDAETAACPFSNCSPSFRPPSQANVESAASAGTAALVQPRNCLNICVNCIKAAEAALFLRKKSIGQIRLDKGLIRWKPNLYKSFRSQTAASAATARSKAHRSVRPRLAAPFVEYDRPRSRGESEKQRGGAVVESEAQRPSDQTPRSTPPTFGSFPHGSTLRAGSSQKNARDRARKNCDFVRSLALCPE